jgi:iron complex outermembrane receptor protein
VPTRISAAIALTLAAAAAAAQESAVQTAVDAFGERVGTEQSGLYSESQVRGFNLTDSGAYRVDDAYFSRSAALNDPVLAGVGVRVGVNATRLAYPAPTGVVNYRLREAGPVNQLKLGAGLRDFGTRVVQGDVSLRKDAFSFAGGVIWRPVLKYAGDNEGHAVDFGGVGAWEIAPDQRLRAFATFYDRGYDGDYAVVPAESAVPPNLKPLHQYAPKWAWAGALSSNYGVLYDGSIGGTTVHASAFRSLFDFTGNDYMLITADAEGHASATTYRYPHRVNRSDSAEVRIGREFGGSGWTHLATVSLRGSRKFTGLVSALAVAHGGFELPEEPPDGA